ncbi:protein FAR-RED ELONGATED HYPOCOTYL 3-like [Syzygium oleosum]|uniref:protein FAR-RED ELONGATED HYPOCOTYL 3-like n=1 Tax=Syzygium oleosum TaxID=219896 RepID=UPI0024BB28FA|nr:protein FAR-RED ELONGATED HYPOCOTYL 3-like [Syzygium oleosum]
MADVTLEGATASLEHGSNDLSVCGIHHRNRRAGEPEEMASNQPGSDHSLGMAIGNEDELHSTSGANIVEGELESNPSEPRVGMEFDSEMAVYKFYRSYAKQTDFNIAKATRYKRRDMRTGCDAKIECVANDGTWKISKVVLEHNHATTALSTSGIVDEVRAVGERALVSDADYSDVDCPRPAPEETQDLIDHFKCLARLDCCSCYSLRVVEARGMENFFWRDSRSKLDYEHFSEILVLDNRTWITKYGIICATFWDLIITGSPPYSDTKPQTIITEFSEEIAEAVSLVLPETCHCLPAWSILNSFRKYLSPLSSQLDVVNLFRECVFLHSQEEFKSKWNSFIGKYKLHDNSWLASLYKMHEKWSHAFTTNVFSVGLLSIQNDEDASHIVRNLSSETMTLTEIACQCEQATKKMRTEEFREDMLCEKNKMFREEFIDCLTLAVEEINSTETLRMFQLTEKGSTKTQTLSSRKAQTVKFDPSDSTLACSCGKFESVGILCVHALKVLIFMNIFKIPSRYLVKRWTKSAKDSLPVDIPAHGLHVMEFRSIRLRKRKRIAMRFIDLAVEHIAKVLKTEEVAVALDDPDGKDDSDWTICEYALETQLDQQNAAKSGMGCPRGKRKVQGHRPAGKRIRDRDRLEDAAEYYGD